MRNVIQIQTVAGPAHATSQALAAALVELLHAEHRATEADLLDAVLVPLAGAEDEQAVRITAA